MSVEAPIQMSANFFIGEDRVLRFTVVDENDAVVDITAYTLEWVLRRKTRSPAAAITKTTSSGISITDGPNGLCEVTLADDDTLSLAPEQYFHTLKRTNDGLETVLSFGDVFLQQAATR